MGIYDRDGDGPRPAPSRPPTPGAAEAHRSLREHRSDGRPLGAVEEDDGTVLGDVIRPMAANATIHRFGTFAFAGLLAILFALTAELGEHETRLGLLAGTVIVFAFAWAAVFVVALLAQLVGLRQGPILPTLWSWFVGIGLCVVWLTALVVRSLG